MTTGSCAKSRQMLQSKHPIGGPESVVFFHPRAKYCSKSMELVKILQRQSWFEDNQDESVLYSLAYFQKTNVAGSTKHEVPT